MRSYLKTLIESKLNLILDTYKMHYEILLNLTHLYKSF